ncbi:hypothetical protein ABIB90_008183 [Bradyrhizobium sp. JR4.1]
MTARLAAMIAVDRASHRPSQIRARIGRNYLSHREGDAILAAVGYNCWHLLRWLQLLLRRILIRHILRL